MTTVKKGSLNPGDSRPTACCGAMRVKSTAPESKGKPAVSSKKRAMK